MAPKVGSKYPEYVALRLDEAMKKKLQKMADVEERSIGAMIRIILREGLETRERKGKMERGSKGRE
jgi:hypothetical protein